MVSPSLALVLMGTASFLVGLSKSGIPSLGVLVAPLFAAAIPARASAGALLPLLIVGDIFAVALYRRRAVWKHLIRLFPWAAAGIVAGYFAMGRIRDSQFGPIVGIITLLMLAVNLWRKLRRVPDAPVPGQWWFAAFFGLLAGFATMIANAASAIMMIYLLSMRLPKEEFIGTAAWYFFVLNLFKVPFSLSLGLITADSLALNLKLAGLVVAGSVGGYLLARRISEKLFALAVQILAAVSAVILIV